MGFNETIAKIDGEISRLREKGKTIWFDIDVDIDGISDKLNRYYKEKGYDIEIRPCKGCLFMKADIFISWYNGE